LKANAARLSINNLSVELRKPGTTSFLLNDISLEIFSGKTLGLIGGSGSGKTMISLALMGLLPSAARILGGCLCYRDERFDLADTASIACLRGRHIAMVFQDPLACLNPVLRIGDQMSDVVERHHRLRGMECRSFVLNAIDRVRLRDSESILTKYPHELSGGMAQRVLIAMALSCRPAVLIADEPTTALDITTQGEILKLLQELQRETGFGMLFISHDIKVVQYLADELIVLNNGSIIETGVTVNVVDNPQHTYTKSLLSV
jgi:peptide/nickel transport system ATP-binding protein